MNLKNILNQFNLPAQCKKYGLSLWQCPQFLFMVMGTIIVVSALVTYTIGTHYIENPQIVVLIILILVAILFTVSFIIIQSFERLAAANRLKSEFVSIVSHQLRSPLSNLKWAIELLMSGRLGRIEEKQTEYFKILKENSARMAELVQDLLVVSKIETATLPLNKKEISFADLVKGLIASFAPFAKASNVEIKFSTSQNLPNVFTDPSQIRLVLENFLDNAIRYIKDRGEVEILLEEKGENLYFEIRDTGVGIPKGDQKFIFQKFFRSENATKYQTQGSGLGLFIAKSIVEKSGGKIGFKSQEGVGSTFWFTLPLK